MAEPVVPVRPSSLWLDSTTPPPARRPLAAADEDREAAVDVAVVGGGITGLVTGLLCARAGLRVGVFESGRIGQGTSGNTTAKLAVLQQLIYDPLTRMHGEEVAADYAAANQAGLDWIVDYCADLPAARVERQAAFTYAWDPADVPDLEAEVAAAQAAGVGATLVDDLDVAFGAVAAVRLGDQAQFDPIPFLHRLADDIESEGGSIWEHTRVLGVSDGRRGATLHTSGGDVHATWVVAATGLPFTDRGMFFARCEPVGSYIVAGRVDEPLEGMWISSSDPSRSLRSAVDVDGSPLVLVGGESHKTGQDIRSMERYQALAADAHEWFGVEDVPHRWFAEDFVSSDMVPFVGPQWPLPTRVLVATGYRKWGLTNAVAAAMSLTAIVDGSAPPRWSKTFDSNRLHVRSLPKLAEFNGNVAAKMVTGWTRDPRSSAGDPSEGQGVVVRRGRSVDAVSRLDAETHTVSAVCTHLGGIVQWNQAEGSWDCPLHGSRFCNDGTMLHGPATKDLEPRDGPDPDSSRD